MSGPRRDPHDPADPRTEMNVDIGAVYGPNYSFGGDAYFGDVHVGDVHIGGRAVPARTVPDLLRAGLRRTPLERPDARRAQHCVDEIDDALRDGAPDRHRIAGALERLTRLLSTAGSLAAAGASLIDPMTGLAVWLGTVGSSVLDQLRTR